MSRNEKTARISEQSHRYLRECVRMDSFITQKLGTMQACNNHAILFYYWNLVKVMETRGVADLFNAELVQDARGELESLPLEPLKTEKEETARKEPPARPLDIS